MTRSATAAREGEEPEMWDRRMELQVGEAARSDDRTVDVCMTMEDAGRESCCTLSRSDVQQSARDMTLLQQQAERKSLIAASTSLLLIVDCSNCIAAGTRAFAATRVASDAATETSAQEKNLNKRADP